MKGFRGIRWLGGLKVVGGQDEGVVAVNGKGGLGVVGVKG